jgi:hypothetical protein
MFRGERNVLSSCLEGSKAVLVLPSDTNIFELGLVIIVQNTIWHHNKKNNTKIPNRKIVHNEVNVRKTYGNFCFCCLF